VDDARNYTTHPSYQQYATGYFLTKEFMLFSQKLYAGEKDAANPEISPLLALDLRGLPPALMITAEFDILRDEDDLYVERMRKAGVEVLYKCMPGQIHCLVGLSPEAAEYKDLKSLILATVHESVK
jgi:acetyl esterase